MSDFSESLPTALAQLQALITEISGEGLQDDRLGELVDKLLGVLDKIPPLDLTIPLHKKLQPQIESCGVSLWNIVVARKTGGKLTSDVNAKLRHIACNLVCLCNVQVEDEVTFKKQIMMSLKTGRAWLDSGNPGMADNALTTASECITKLLKCVMDKHEKMNDRATYDKEKMNIDKDLFKVVCYKAESACYQEQHDTAIGLAMQAKEMLHRLPKEASFLSMLCYNFGVETYQHKKYEHSVAWLRESFEIGKGAEPCDSKNQARTLRLLSNAYIEWDPTKHWQKSLNAVGLANAEQSHPAGLYLRVRILTQGEPEMSRLISAVEDVIRHPDVTVELGLSTVKLLSQGASDDIVFDTLNQLENRFKTSISRCKITLTHLELLIAKQRMETAKQMAEQIIQEHNTGHALDVANKKRFHLIVWDTAGENFEKKNFIEALQWYNYSYNLFPKIEGQDANAAKLHRNRASCYLQLDNMDKAKEAVELAESSDVKSPHTQYIKFKLALLQMEDDKALEAIKKMGAYLTDGVKDSKIGPQTGGDNNVQGLICLAAQLAFEKNNRPVAIKALESLVDCSNDAQQVLTALRCLTRLKLTFLAEDDKKITELSCLESYLTKAYNTLTSPQHDSVPAMYIQQEATWFMKIAWNVALQCDDTYKDMYTMFNMCYKFANLCPSDMANLVRQKTCMLMAAAACLHTSKTISDEVDKRSSLHRVLEFISQCRQICARINEGKLNETERSKDTTPILLVLYEFEAKAKLGDPTLEQVLENALAMPNSEPKTFESIAALALEPPAENRSISIRALKVAIKKHLQMENPDFAKCSKNFHSLVSLSLQCDTSKEETWTYYTEIVNLLETRAKDNFPEMETLWLMTKAWNCGIHLYSASNYMEAKKWCELSMRLLNQLSSLRGNYESQMNEVYGEVLARIDTLRKGGTFEE
ncbi:unnamed protein product [Owenia fusiformis]|uniref:Uncharacterized protein n=1 Tax=Owenia fusiformis TaxID=6347 RepID=A0A8J1TCM5_OWEFU|nr:unnamed protein product [Owenia fusiformis]